MTTAPALFDVDELRPKVQMSDHASRILIDWTITIGDDEISGTWAFDKRAWVKRSA